MSVASKSRRLRVGLLSAAAVGALAAAPSAFAAPSTTSFSDAAGDAAAPIDVRATTIRSDASGIRFTTRVTDVDGRAPLLAYVPQYATTFVTDNGLNGSATAVFGNADTTLLTLTTQGAGQFGYDSFSVAGTRTVDAAANTVSLHFSRAALVAGFGTADPSNPFGNAVAPGAGWNVLGASTKYQQNTLGLGRPDTATAPAGTRHVVGS